MLRCRLAGGTMSEMVEELEQRLGIRGIQLERLRSNCVSKAYRATLPDGRMFFTKLAKVNSAKARAFLQSG